MVSNKYRTKIINQYLHRVLKRTADDPNPRYYHDKFKGVISHQDFLVGLVDSEGTCG